MKTFKKISHYRLKLSTKCKKKLMQLHRGFDPILCVHKTKKHIRKSDSTLSSDDLHFARGKNLKWVGFGVKTHLITYLSDHHKKVLDTFRIKKQFLFLFFILPNSIVVSYIVDLFNIPTI